MVIGHWFPRLLLALVLCAPRQTCGLTKREDAAKCSFFDGLYTSVMRRVFKHGFHKELSTDIELMLTTSLLPPDCRLVVEETIPKGMYVDPYQLRDLSESRGLHSFVAAKVDVEKPEFESEAFRVFVFARLQSQENLRVASVEMPVHLRYHLPAGSDPHRPFTGQQPEAMIKLQNPRLLLSCESENVASLCPESSVTSYCDWTGTSKCEYLQLPYKVNVNAIEVSVPVGNYDYAVVVVGVTSTLISGSTFYLLGIIFRNVDAKRVAP